MKIIIDEYLERKIFTDEETGEIIKSEILEESRGEL